MSLDLLCMTKHCHDLPTEQHEISTPAMSNVLKNLAHAHADFV